MKKLFRFIPLFLRTLTLLLVSCVTAHAHEHEAGTGLFGLPPEYVHVLLNPIPVYGLALGVLALVAALVARSKAARVLALWLVIVTSASAWPVAYYGQNAYKEIRGQADDAGQVALDTHMERAEKYIYVFYATALLGIAALVSQRKFPRSSAALAVITLAAGIASLGVGAWIGKAGGQVRHPEFRNVLPSADHDEAAPQR